MHAAAGDGSMETNDLAADIASIRAQVANTITFHGYRSPTIALTGLLGIAAAWVQPDYLPNPNQQLDRYADFWIGVALVNLFIVGAEFWFQWTMAPTPLGQRLTVLAIKKLVPSFVSGVILTTAILRLAPESGWMLPGLWAILFSLGIFASTGFLPPATRWAGFYYMASGTICLALGKGPMAFSPWLMVLTFGMGQILSAIILHQTLERKPA